MVGGVRGFRLLFDLQKGKCYFCGHLLADDRHLSPIHHINGKHDDNRLINRCVVHISCHNLHHSEGEK